MDIAEWWQKLNGEVRTSISADPKKVLTAPEVLEVVRVRGVGPAGRSGSIILGKWNITCVPTSSVGYASTPDVRLTGQEHANGARHLHGSLASLFTLHGQFVL